MSTLEKEKYVTDMQIKYGPAYMSDISKLNAEDKYNEKGILKPEYELTPAERKALLCYVPELTQPSEILKGKKDNQNNEEERYQIFLGGIRKKQWRLLPILNPLREI